MVTLAVPAVQSIFPVNWVMDRLLHETRRAGVSLIIDFSRSPRRGVSRAEKASRMSRSVFPQ